MGYGKTTAVREYLRRSKSRTIWVSAFGGGEAVFWRDLCRLLAQAFPAGKDVVESLLLLGYPYDPVLVDAASELLARLAFTRQTILVVDDFHLLAGREGGSNPVAGGGFGRLCERLTHRMNAALRIVLISRHQYRSSSELLQLKGILHLIDSTAFALTPQDIRKYYALCGVPLTKRQATVLCEQTGGWISAVYLYLLRYSQRKTISRPESINTLLETEVFDRLSAGTKNLLCVVCPLEYFTQEQASFLSGADASSALSELITKNSFLSYDPAEKSYTLHDIFRQYLQNRFFKLPPEQQQAVQRRCADWFISAGDPASAIEACYAAGDFDQALTLLEDRLNRAMVTEKARFYMELFKACPEKVLERHMDAAFKYALAALSVGDYQTFGSQLGWIGKQCEGLKPLGGELEPQVRAWQGELEALHSLAAYNDIAAMSVHHRRANDLLGRPTRLFGQAPWTLGSPSVLFMFHRESGHLANEVRLMYECLPHYYLLAGGHGSGAEHMLEAEAMFNAGDFEGATVACHHGQAMAASHGQLCLVLCAMFLRVRLAVFAGDFEEARDILDAMRFQIQEKQDFFLLHTVDLCEGFFYAVLGRAEAVPEWLMDEGGEKRLYSFAGGFYYIVQGKTLLLKGQFAALIGRFAWLLESGVFSKNLLFTIYAHIYTASAQAALGREAEAKNSLQTALSLALPDQLYVPFAENYILLAPILKKSGSWPGLDKITALARKMRLGQRSILRTIETGVVPFGLTRREYEIALLAVEGLSNIEIAEQLFVSVNTIKTHLKSAYQKTGASSRQTLRKIFKVA